MLPATGGADTAAGRDRPLGGGRMNDADWFKKFRRGKRGGCTMWVGSVLVLVLVGLAAG